MPVRIVLLLAGAVLLVLFGRGLQRLFMEGQAALGAFGARRLQRGIALLMLAPLPLLALFVGLYYTAAQGDAWLYLSHAMLLVGLGMAVALLAFLSYPLLRAGQRLPAPAIVCGALSLAAIALLFTPAQYARLVSADAYLWSLVLGLAFELSCYAALWALWQGLMRGQTRQRRP
jgi:hypothetical protein